MENKKFAVLIDAENISTVYLEGILNEVALYGTVTYKRMYGDFSSSRMTAWNQKAVEYSIVQVQQPRYSTAKNCSDIMLVIDAMDILHNDKVEGFCIVSSDSDFTRLVNRLCEDGKEVIGMGNRMASRSLKAACTEYKSLEILIENEENDENEENEENTVDKSNKEDLTKTASADKEEQTETNVELSIIKEAIKNIIMSNERKGKATGLGEIGNRLVKTYSDFDVRNYGYKSLTTFIEDMEEFEIEKQKNIPFVSIMNNKISKLDIENYIIEVVKKTPIDLGNLGNKVHEKFKNFNVRDYGYSKFESFICSMPKLEVKETGKKAGHKVVSIKNTV